MAYLERLIERATDSGLDLENNQIGSFAITPQHGSGLFVYHIYKIDKSFRKSHVASLDIDSTTVDIMVNADVLNRKQIDEIINTINNLYDRHNITTKNF